MMNIIVLHGPNLNLLGSISAQSKQRITLDKINKALRLHVRNSDINLKISQTHKVFQANQLLFSATAIGPMVFFWLQWLGLSMNIQF